MAWATWVGLEVLVVSVVLSLAGLLCAVLKLSVTELAAVEDSRFTTIGVVSAAAGLFCGEKWENKVGEGKIGSWHRGGSRGQKSEGIKDNKENKRGKRRVHVGG